MVVSAVSYLNTWPLVWGFLHGPQRGIFDFRFDLPVHCAQALREGAAQIGLLPCAEIDRLGLDCLTDVGIACSGPVRSILLVSKVPVREIRRLAVDSSSRTSVALTRIILQDRYGVTPLITPIRPTLDEMLIDNDAALIIGDPALRLDPATLPYEVLDLGSEWIAMTQLPMVFAVWSGKPEFLTEAAAEAFRDSYKYGRAHVDEMVEHAASERGFDKALARDYFSRYIVYPLTAKHREGLQLFRSLVKRLDVQTVAI